jgi:hypothetical protein
MISPAITPLGLEIVKEDDDEIVLVRADPRCAICAFSIKDEQIVNRNVRILNLRFLKDLKSNGALYIIKTVISIYAGKNIFK